MIDATRQDVEKAVHKARSLVTVKPLPDGMAVVAGPEGRDERPRALHRIRGMVKRQQIDIALESLPIDGFTWRTKARIRQKISNGLGMVDAICEELHITRGTEPCN